MDFTKWTDIATKATLQSHSNDVTHPPPLDDPYFPP
jgi:hypothetical protein